MGVFHPSFPGCFTLQYAALMTSSLQAGQIGFFSLMLHLLLYCGFYQEDNFIVFTMTDFFSSAEWPAAIRATIISGPRYLFEEMDVNGLHGVILAFVQVSPIPDKLLRGSVSFFPVIALCHLTQGNEVDALDLEYRSVYCKRVPGFSLRALPGSCPFFTLYTFQGVLS